MQSSFFTVFSTGQDFWVDPEVISAKGDTINPYLRVPLYLKLLPPDNKIEYILTDIEATIIFTGFKHETSKIHKICNIDVPIRSSELVKGTETNIALDFPLDQAKIAIIENNRKEQAVFTLNFTFHWGLYSSTGFSDGNWDRRFLSQFGAEYHKILTVHINESKWGKEILPGLGYQAFRMIEVPSENQLIPNEYRESLAELDAAKGFMRDGYYDKVVGHCRSALDPFKDKIKGLIKHISNEKEATWIETMTVDTNIWLDKIFRTAKSLASETHHSPSVGHFDKTEAEIIYMITVGIIAYIGRISK